jgi:outer membrane cobalamin receptor
LYSLHVTPAITFAEPVIDPRTGVTVFPQVTFGSGNPQLQPETGTSWTAGFVYASTEVPGLQLSVTNWHVTDKGNVQILSAQALVDNENLFPSSVIRDAQGNIISVNQGYVNFGKIDVAGTDLHAAFAFPTSMGEFTPAVDVTNTYHYTTALIPGAPIVDDVSNANVAGPWAPRWKGVATLGWKRGAVTASVNGRYVGRYLDYDGTTPLGNFWLVDTNVRLLLADFLGRSPIRAKAGYIEFGGVNMFNRLPQRSSYFAGYDPTQGDLRGRFLYGRVGVSF